MKRRPRGPGGRPPLPPEKKLGERVFVNLTMAEREALEQAAGQEPLATYLRRLVLRHLARQGRES